MSYSFTVRTANKQEASSKIAEELAKVVASQAIHQKDQAQAQAASDAFVALLQDDDMKDVVVQVNGSLGTVNDEVTNASVSVHAYLALRA